ncbi:hypothetical protein EVA_21260 [gut metagenome]|uniref:Uncharacterized protein n=1 Tax=gut metagenome TaxID=749906 RepID=J9F861_9ZZZZ
MEALRVGSMHTQLVGASGEGVEGHQRLRAPFLEHFVVRHRLFAVNEVHQLPRSVVQVRTQRQTDVPFRSGGPTVEQGHIALVHSAVGKLLLQMAVHLQALGDDQQARRVLVEPVYDERSGGIGIALAHPAEDRVHRLLARHREQACGLVHNAQILVLEDYLERRIAMDVLGQRVGLDGQALEHEPQNGSALALAGRIVAAVVADFLFGRVAPPELGHAHGAQVMQVGILQQLGGCTFARSGRRFLAHRLLEELAQVDGLTPCIFQPELFEEPELQGSRALFPFLLQGGDGGLVSFDLSLLFVEEGLPPTFQTLHFSFLELAFADHRVAFRLRQRGLCQCGLRHCVLCQLGFRQLGFRLRCFCYCVLRHCAFRQRGFR